MKTVLSVLGRTHPSTLLLCVSLEFVYTRIPKTEYRREGIRTPELLQDTVLSRAHLTALLLSFRKNMYMYIFKNTVFCPTFHQNARARAHNKV